MELIDNEYKIEGDKIVPKEEEIIHKQGYNKSSVRKENAIRYAINDILQGATTSVILSKLREDSYGLNFNYSVKQSERILYQARDRIKEDFKKELPTLREGMMAKLLDVYTECREMGDRGNALKSLDQIAKITGMNEQKVNLNGKVDSNITIDFGLKNEEEE